MFSGRSSLVVDDAREERASFAGASLKQLRSEGTTMHCYLLSLSFVLLCLIASRERERETRLLRNSTSRARERGIFQTQKGIFLGASAFGLKFQSEKRKKKFAHKKTNHHIFLFQQQQQQQQQLSSSALCSAFARRLASARTMSRTRSRPRSAPAR